MMLNLMLMMDDVKPDKDDVNPTIIFNTSSSYCGYCDFIIFLITSSFGKKLWKCQS
jgi:hypothetical protein